MDKFDLMVIGSGSGLEVSADAAERGLSVAVVEEGPFGGTCLNRGCIPSKMLIHCADVMETIQGAHRFGITAKVESVDWQSIIRRVSEEVDGDARAVEEGNRQSTNITVFKGTGRFVGEKTLEVNGEKIQAETVLIAAGTRPSIPEIAGLEDVPYITSDEALRLPQQPGRLAIVGGGYIAGEMAHFFGAMGTQVTIIHRRLLMLREEDEDVARRFTEVYQRKFNMLLNAEVAQVSRNGDEIRLVVASDGRRVELAADALLLATGRIPNTDTLQVGETGVEVDQRGYIQTDQFLETNVPGIWALGDIVGKYLLKHSANLEAAYAANNILNPDDKVAVDYSAMPHAIFASPQVASVGLTEQELRAMGREYVVASYNYADTAYGSSIEDRDGFVKVLADPETGGILGTHIIGTDASILIQEVANAMRMGLTTDAITRSIYVHPALPEVVQRAFGALPV
ncbi:MAG: mycothione reductase [Chloroflexi bacterium]|nr:mycothione reductase [Chloroflexota bacterium]MCI0780353.1 mycothione reductase [Chloroflexota bacterium]MCI0785485.1 mycothione reductase [Chloroflexota bacterium]